MEVQCSPTLMTKAADFSKMLVPVYQNTQHHIPEDRTLYTALHDKLKFHSIMDKTPTHALFTQHYISLTC